jgi:hypothetical protein
MAEQIEILNGDDRAHALRTLKKAIRGASGASRTHLLSVLRSLNPNAARSRAFKGASSMAKSTKKAAPRKGHKKHTVHKHNPTTGGTYQLREVGSKVKSKVAAAGRRAASNFKGLDIPGILTEGAGVGLGLVGTNIIAKQADKFLPASFPAVVKAALASAVVGGLAVAMGGSRGFTRYVAVGAIGEFIQSTARTYLPAGLMAGTDATDTAAGYWDDTTGQWVPYGQQMAGIIYDPAYGIPSTDDRPVSI